MIRLNLRTIYEQKNLLVYLSEHFVGTLTKQTNGAIEFKYDEAWIEKGFGISLSLPLEKRTFRGSEVSFYFDNLLPENRQILEAIATKFKAESTSQFDVLHSIGKDCIGALSFFDEEVAKTEFRKMQMTALDDAHIARKIRGLAFDTPLGMEDGDFRISLAGAQEKMALLRWKGKWCEPKGATPTSHIFKKRMDKLDFTHSIENEWTCLTMASQFGVEACKATIEQFEDQSVLCVERFDRVWKDNILLRIPQEDLCQATGTSPLKKYERDGGPTLKDAIRLIQDSNNGKEDRIKLFRVSLYNDLLFNTDGHMKNISIYLLPAGFALTPMYDLMSAHFMKSQRPDRYADLRGSISVNGKFHYRDITLADWEIEGLSCGLLKSEISEVFDGFSKALSSLIVPASDQREFIEEGMRLRGKKLGLI